jgi:hypothetical protein
VPTHVFGSIPGLILAIFGTFALGAYLTRSHAGRMGLVAMVITVLGSALFLPGMGVSAFAAPEEGQAYLAGIEGLTELPTSSADIAFGATSLLGVVLLFVGNVLLGVAVWRSGTLPKWAGALWVGCRASIHVPLGRRVCGDDRAREHPAYGAGGCAVDSDRWGVDGLERLAPTLCGRLTPRSTDVDLYCIVGACSSEEVPCQR